MKKLLLSLVLALCVTLAMPSLLSAQAPSGNVVNFTYLHTKWPEKGSMAARDSLVAIYNNMVIKKNEFILSHREYRHFYTADSRDYIVIEEFADFASMQKAAARNTELEKLAWPDEAASKPFFDAMDSYFERWHGDGLFQINNALSKN